LVSGEGRIASPLSSSLTPSPSTFSPADRRLRALFWLLAISLGALQVWAHRNEVSPDSISYIELAWASVRGGLHQIVNAYWSPLYPFLLSLPFRYFHPSPKWEFTTAHLLNFGIYLTCLAAFELFLSELLLAREESACTREGSKLLEGRILRIWGYLFFIWSGYFWVGLTWVTPDLCVSAVVFCAVTLLYRIRRGCNGVVMFAGLGAFLGLGYFAKSAMLPLSIVFLVSAFFLSRRGGASFRAAALRILLVVGVLAGVALPFVFSLSAMKDRITFGDTGKIAYVEFVNRATRSVHWQGGPPGTGMPVHPTRQIMRDPEVYEFAAPIPGSYPPWYDPSYWYDGARPRFHWKDQSLALFRAANKYLKMFSVSGVLWVVLVAVMWLLRSRKLAWARRVQGDWLILMPLIAPLLLYSVVLVEFRYVASFALILLLWALSKLCATAEAPPQRTRRLLGIVALAPALVVSWMALRDLRLVIRNQPYEPWVVAQHLRAMGIPPGTDVGYVGTALDAYWAHLAQLRVIGEIPDAERASFVLASPERKDEVMRKFRDLGAAAVLTKFADVAHTNSNWQAIPGTRDFVYRLEPNTGSAGEKGPN
jgi:hypothetical protein